MKIFNIITLFSLLLPSLFQFIFGNKSANKVTNLNFGYICGLNIVIQILLTFVGIYVVSSSLESQNNQYVCGMPIVGFIMISFFIFIIMLIMMIIQLYIKFCNKNKVN